MPNLLELLDQRLGVMTVGEAGDLLGYDELSRQLEGLPQGEVEILGVVWPEAIATTGSFFLLRRGAELGSWV